MAARTVRIFESIDYDGDVRQAADTLRGGGLVVIPTETVYGAAGALNHPDSRRRLIALRGGPAKPFTIHLAHRADAHQYLPDVGDFGERLMKKLWPGPVALVFEVPEARRREVAANLKVDAADIYDSSGAVTLRCPDHIVASDILSQLSGPVGLTAAASTSAGATTSPGGSTAADLPSSMLDQVDLIIDAGPNRISKPSTILKVGDGKYTIIRQGIYDERIIEKMLRTTILFVCSGNTCRSPMAEAIARHLLAQKLSVSESDLERKGITVVSAGSYAMPGSRATPQAVEAVKGVGADLTHHRSRPLTVELIHQADVIYTMSRNHAAAVMSLVPSAREKVATLDPVGDIEDPIGGDVSLYVDLAGQLQGLIEKRLNELES